ncbi:MAG: DUF3500 domain-containing protein [Verrucomicrobiota bacterium JB023]|nr:DUF3500 domain-containing protein [Verrucomicrobiota bacterium JB023]
MIKTLLTLLLFSLPCLAHQHGAVTDMTTAAKTFLASLDDEQKKKVMHEFADEERENWHYVPMDRSGIRLDALSSHQQALAHSLLSSALSAKGHLTAATIMNLEQVLRDQGGDPDFRDPGAYFLALFGSPSAEGSWGWRLEGHHLSLNLTIVDGHFAQPTPHFFGSNPGEVGEGPLQGTRVLGSIEDAARTLARSLHRQGKHVRFSNDPPREILTRQNRSVEALAAEGLEVAEMNEDERKNLIELVRAIASFHRKELLSISGDELASAQFGWAGDFEKGAQHYFRIQTPDFLIEYANTQNRGNHAHLVWRDFDRDFGRDVLQEHIKEGH